MRTYYGEIVNICKDAPFKKNPFFSLFVVPLSLIY
jgi:hypothetical protein